MKIALAQLNLCVGDIAGNTSRIIDTLRRARDEGARLVAFPELAVTGYPPEDLLFRPGFHARAAHALRQIAAATHGITVVIGHPEKVGDAVYNSASVIEDGAVRAVYRKQRLPNYEVFDEKRYFTPGDAPAITSRSVARSRRHWSASRRSTARSCSACATTSARTSSRVR